jgi:HSP20 family protein
MKIIRYQTSPVFTPARNFTTLQHEMDRLFDLALPALGPFPVEFPLDLYQSGDSFIVRAELPGFRREELEVDVVDGVLTVTAHQKGEAKAKDEATTPERKVTRSVSLPEQVKVDAIQARYENGILTITLPKQEEAKPRQIAVEVK